MLHHCITFLAFISWTRTPVKWFSNVSTWEIFEISRCSTCWLQPSFAARLQLNRLARSCTPRTICRGILMRLSLTPFTPWTCRVFACSTRGRPRTIESQQWIITSRMRQVTHRLLMFKQVSWTTRTFDLWSSFSLILVIRNRAGQEPASFLFSGLGLGYQCCHRWNNYANLL